MIDIIKQYSQNKAVLLISHNLRIMLHTDYLYILDNGKIVKQGDPDKLLRIEEGKKLSMGETIQNVIG